MHATLPPSDDNPPPPPSPYFRALPAPNWPRIDAEAARLGLTTA